MCLPATVDEYFVYLSLYGIVYISDQCHDLRERKNYPFKPSDGES